MEEKRRTYLAGARRRRRARRRPGEDGAALSPPGKEGHGVGCEWAKVKGGANATGGDALGALCLISFFFFTEKL
jgi:hypothetical protein